MLGVFQQFILKQSILHCWGTTEYISTDYIAAEYTSTDYIGAEYIALLGDSARLVSHLSRYRSGQARGSRAGGRLAKFTKVNHTPLHCT